MEALGPLVLAFLTGAGAGLLYFIGLMLTIRRIRFSTRPGLLLTASGIVRAGLLLALFLAVTGGRWQGLLACTAGFISARHMMILLHRPDKRREGGQG